MLTPMGTCLGGGCGTSKLCLSLPGEVSRQLDATEERRVPMEGEWRVHVLLVTLLLFLILKTGTKYIHVYVSMAIIVIRVSHRPFKNSILPSSLNKTVQITF